MASVVLIGVAPAVANESIHSSKTNLKLYATDMNISSKAMPMRCVSGTATGRIFMSGNDEYLYELEYSSAESWFASKVTLKNQSLSFGASLLPSFLQSGSGTYITGLVIDDDRQCLYSVTSGQVISVYYLGSTGLDAQVTLRGTLRDISKHAQQLAPGSTNLDVRTLEIVGLYIVSPREAHSDIHAVAITSKGVRLYLSHRGQSFNYAYSSYGGSGSTAQPSGLRIVHVREPPNAVIHPSEQYSNRQPNPSDPTAPASSRTYKISTVNSALYSTGLLLASQSPSVGDVTGATIVTCFFPDVAAISSSTAGRTQQPAYGLQTYPNFSSYQHSVLTENVKHVLAPGTVWALEELHHPISNFQATHSPVAFNELSSQFSEPPREFALLSNVGLTFVLKLRPVDVLYSVILHDSRSDLELFCHSLPREQICAMLFAILGKNSHVVGNGAIDDGMNRPGGRLDVNTNVRQILLHYGGKPVLNSAHLVELSPKLRGLLLYLTRLLRPIWNGTIAKTVSGRVLLGFPEDLLVRGRQDLQSLKDFCEADPFLFQAPPGEHRGTTPLDESWKVENTSVTNFLILASQTVEAISFILLLHDFGFQEIVSRCDVTERQKLMTITFCELVMSALGRELARSLVNAIISQQIGQQVNVDTISQILQQRCGSFCSSDDVMLYKAEEYIKKAGESSNTAERAQTLLDSLRLYSKGCRNITYEKLNDITAEYRRLQYAKGAIELPLRCAQEWDADRSGREYWLAGCQGQGPGIENYRTRLRCYDLVLASLQRFDDIVEASRGAAGHDVITDGSQLVRQTAYRTALSSRDVVFHSALYDWLIERGSADELLEVDTPFLEGHLQREPLTLQNGELLWQYYVKSGQYIKAAETLHGLSGSNRFPLTLERRMEFLSLAIGNAKSHSISETGHEENTIAFLTELEEKMEVAQAQLETLNVIRGFAPDELIQQKIQELSGSFKTVTELYEDYAEPLHLPEVKLLLFHVSEHRDEQLVISIWRFLFDKLGEAETMEEEFESVSNLVERMGRKFYPSPSAFPLDYITKTLEDMTIKNRENVPRGWAPRVLHRALVPYNIIFELMNQMYESQVPPYNIQANVQALSSDMAVILRDWLSDIQRGSSSRTGFPADLLSKKVDMLMRELAPYNSETRKLYEEIKTTIRQEF